MDKVTILPQTSRCPWCRPSTNEHGVTSYLYAASETGRVLCGYCDATGLFSEWQKHPEYARLLQDDRLAAYKIEWPK